MIVSHAHRFIFLKTRKTAGTSIETLLSAHIEPEAIVTPVRPPVEGHEPRNYTEIPDGFRTRKLKRTREGRRDVRMGRWYFHHMSAELMRARLGRKVFDSYYKFCFERDPWDKTVSWYFYRTSPPDRPTFRDFVMNHELPHDFPRYSIDGRAAVDFVGRYENLEADLQTALDEIGLDIDVGLTFEKSGLRPRDATVEAMYDVELANRVATVFASEVALLGYEAPSFFQEREPREGGPQVIA